MYKLLFLFFLSLLSVFSGCNHKQNSLAGNWILNIKLQKQILPVMIKLTEKKDSISGVLQNGAESIALKGQRQKDHFIIDIGENYGKIQGDIISEDTISGEWIRSHLKDYIVPFEAIRSSKKNLFSHYENIENPLNITGKWRVDFDDDNSAVALFEQEGSRVQGSIITNTGDYRFLDGFIEKDELSLYGFDGGFAFIVRLTFKGDLFKGNLFWGKSTQRKLKGVKDDLATLKNPLEMVGFQKDKKINFQLKSLKGESVSLLNKRFKNKVKVIQIFGSWCPNCIDETKYFINWRKNNPEKLNNVAFLAVAFEYFDTKKRAIKELQKLKNKLDWDYPLLLGDFKGTDKITGIFPIEKVMAFPTTLFLSKDNKLKKVHTGFSGQATGVFFKKFQDEFESILLELETL